MIVQQLNLERQARSQCIGGAAPVSRPLQTSRHRVLRLNAASSATLQAARVEEWKHMLDTMTSPKLRDTMCDLLVAAPAAVHHCPIEMREIVHLLHSYTRVQRLYSSSPSLLPYKDLLALHERYTPQILAQKLDRLSIEVSKGLDASVQGADLLVAVAPCIVPLLEAPPGAIGQRAAALAELIPEFLPSSILRAIPELLMLDWSIPITEEFVSRAGDVVIFGPPRGVHASLLLSGQAVPGLAASGASASRSSSKDSSAASASTSQSAASGLDSESNASGGACSTSSSSSSSSSSGNGSSTASATRSNGGSIPTRRPSGRVAGSGGSHAAASLAQLSLPGSKVAIYATAPALPQHHHHQQQQQGFGPGLENSSYQSLFDTHPAPQQQQQQQRQEQGHQQQQPEDGRQLMAVVTNSRCLICVSEGGRMLSERYADPYRDEEALVSCGAGKPGSWSAPGQVPGAFFRDQPRMWLMWPSLTDRTGPASNLDPQV